MLRMKCRLMFSLFRANRTLCAAVVLLMAFAFTAAQISLSSVNALTMEISTTPMTSAFILTFPQNGLSDESLIALSEIFNGNYTIDGRLLSSGFYCIIQDEQPTLLGVKNMGESTWFVQAEGRYFTEKEIETSQSVTVMSVSHYLWDDFDYENHSISAYGSEFVIVGLGDFDSPSMFFIGHQDVYNSVSDAAILNNQLQTMTSIHDDMNTESADISRAYDLRTKTLLIPYTTFESMQLRPQIVSMVFPNASRSSNQIFAELTLLFPEATVTKPNSAESYLSSSMKEALKISAMMAACSIIFINGLVVIWLLSLKSFFTPMRNAGASNRSIRRIAEIGTACLTVIGYAVSEGICLVLSVFLANLKLSLHLALPYQLLLVLFVLLNVHITVRILFFRVRPGVA